MKSIRTNPILMAAISAIGYSAVLLGVFYIISLITKDPFTFKDVAMWCAIGSISLFSAVESFIKAKRLKKLSAVE